MTLDQEKIAEDFISEMKANNGITNSLEFRIARSIDETQMYIIIRGLHELDIITFDYNDDKKTLLTERFGWTFPGFAAQRHLAQSQKIIDSETNKYDLLTKRFIYKARYVPFILSGLALIVSIFAYFKEPKKDKPTTQSEQRLTEPTTNTNTLLPVDTGQKTMPK